MRTTVDLPDPLFRKVKAVAALRGSSLKELMIHALEREIAPAAGKPSKRKPARRVKFPLIPATGGKKIDLSDFDFDDLLT